MFVHNLDPVLLKFWIFEIRWYGLVYVLGFLLIYYILIKKRDKFELSRDDVDKYIFNLVLGTVIGARLFHVLFSEFSFYLNNLIEIFKFWNGGMAFFGGLLGAVLVTYRFCKNKDINFLKLGDLLVIPIALILGLGRIANFINAELVGTVSNFSLCVEFDGVCRHPYQLYSAFKRFLVFGVLILLNTKERKEGYIFWNFIFLLGIGRFLVDFFKEGSNFVGQYLSLIMAAIALYFLIKDYWK